MRDSQTRSNKKNNNDQTLSFSYIYIIISGHGIIYNSGHGIIYTPRSGLPHLRIIKIMIK